MGNSVSKNANFTTSPRDEIVCYGYIRNIESIFISSKLYTSIPNEIYNLCYKYYHDHIAIFCIEKHDKKNIIYLKHSYGEYLSVLPFNQINMNGNGERNGYSQWIPFYIYQDNKTKVKLKNVSSGKYLRIYNNHSCERNNYWMDVGGTGGVWTLFKIHPIDKHNENIIKLESNKCPSVFIALNIDNNYNIYPQHININDQNNKKPENDELLIKPGIVAIQQDNNQYIAAKTNDKDNVCSNYNDIDSLSQWSLESYSKNQIKFQNMCTGKYLRIFTNRRVNILGTGGSFTIFKYNLNDKTLESNKFNDVYLATKKNDKYLNKLYAIKKSESNGLYNIRFDIKYLNDQKMNIVLIKNIKTLQYISCSKNNTLQVNISNNLNNKSNDNKYSQHYQWLFLNHFENGKLIKLQNIKSHKYLRMHNYGYSIDVGGSGGKWTLFRYDIKNKTLESNALNGMYLSIKKDNNMGYAITMVRNNQIDDYSRFELINIQ